LILQILTGLLLARTYRARIERRFYSVSAIMESRGDGWFIRYMHANGASLFLFVFICTWAEVFTIGLFYLSILGWWG